MVRKIDYDFSIEKKNPNDAVGNPKMMIMDLN